MLPPGTCAASLELLIHKQEAWLDFKPRHERFAEALRTLLRSMLRDPAEAEQQLQRVLTTSDFGDEKPKAKKARASKALKKG